MSRATPDSLPHEFGLLRNRIEAKIEAPAVILVTSATDGDGSSLTALAVARSFAESNQKTALVTSGKPGAPNRSAFEEPLAFVRISTENASRMSRSGVTALIERLRSEFVYVVFDAGDLPHNPIGLLASASATGILIAFRSGRQQLPADGAMLDMLDRSKATMLGVVMTDRETIDEFAERSAVEAPSFLQPSPRTPEHHDVSLRQAGTSI